MRNSAILLTAVTFFFACSKNNDQAKTLDGTWSLDSWSWDGNGSTAAGSYSDSLGTWAFEACKASSENCSGKVTGFIGTDGDVNISWYIREKGTKFTMAPDKNGTPVGNLGGEWEIVELNDSKFILISETCGSCSINGNSRLEFSK